MTSTFRKIQGLFLSPVYYLIHKNILIGYFFKKFICKFYYKKFTFNLNVDNIPLSLYSSFFFKTYEINDRILVEKNLSKKNSCIIVGGGIGFIAVIAYHLTKKKILLFEINNKIIQNLRLNLKLNECNFTLYNKNIIFKNNNKYTQFSIGDSFLETSQFVKNNNILNVENIFYNKIYKLKNYNTLIIDAEGAEYNFLLNLKKFKNIKYIFFELHYNLLSKNKINRIFSELSNNFFVLQNKFLNSFYFKKI
jgi:FkbM family methyltransferase